MIMTLRFDPDHKIPVLSKCFHPSIVSKAERLWGQEHATMLGADSHSSMPRSHPCSTRGFQGNPCGRESMDRRAALGWNPCHIMLMVHTQDSLGQPSWLAHSLSSFILKHMRTTVLSCMSQDFSD